MGQKGLNTKPDTIAAVSTPQGRGGIAVVRLSGPDAISILQRCWRGADPSGFASHTLHLGWLVDARGEDIDQVVCAYYKGPRSYTGEDVVELSCHGSPWLQQAVVSRLIDCGARAALPGEFTQRAFLNGTLDLAQAEGVADMIAASSAASARIAASQLRGDFSRRLARLRGDLLDLGVLLELELDFSEEDVEFADRSRLIGLTRTVLGVVEKLAGSFRAGNAFKNGVPVAIVGVPNSGKSTFLNALVGEERAIVSDIPGTTRDVIEDTVELEGVLFRFIDTAGLRESDDVVERIGVERARRKIAEAAVVLYMIDPTQDVARQLALMHRTVTDTRARVITIVSKADLTKGESTDGPAKPEGSVGYDTADDCIAISARTGAGISDVTAALVAIATEEYDPQQELIITNVRHYEALRRAEAPLHRLLEGLQTGVSADFLAQDLREASHHLGTITGDVTSTDILHTIFSRYCIGK